MTSTRHISTANIFDLDATSTSTPTSINRRLAPQQTFNNATMNHSHLALLLLFAIFSIISLATHNFENCSSLERFLIESSAKRAQRLITSAGSRSSSDSIETTNRSDASQELNETNKRWRADIHKTIAMELPKITFSCNNDNTTVQALCDAAPDSISNTDTKSPILLVKTDSGNLALCKNYTSRDPCSAALPIANELVDMAMQMEQKKRAEAVLQNLINVIDHIKQILEDFRKLLLSLDEFHLKDFWRRTMDCCSKKLDDIMAPLD